MSSINSIQLVSFFPSDNFSGDHQIFILFSIFELIVIKQYFPNEEWFGCTYGAVV